MADNLIFPIKFDLEKGVKDALTDGDKALDRIAKALEKHPITIKLRMDNRVARGASAELTGFKKQLAELTQQWNSLTAAERGSAAGAAIRDKFRALRTEAQGYTSTLQAAVKAEDKMRESHSKTAASANKLSSAYHNQSTYLSRLIQRMAAYAGVSYVGNFLTNVREVTAQFELQRISLGAIIQDQQRANQLFEEIKTFALKSPVKILDLTKYTKQLAAYKIGVDELFETTKKLTDVSVGLGVSMDRVVLAYGQVRARGALYASEIRQFTEMGVPIVEELAAKLTKMNGELVTAKDVLKQVEKGAISFELVKEVFDDMTSAGGIFYNMQEKQGNTLYGMWQKLGDAAAMMYDQIGNTSSVNEGIKMAIQTLRYLMLHWKQVGIVVGGVSVYILANTIATKNNAIATAAATTANKLHIASLQMKLSALRLEQMNLKSTAIVQRIHTAATISATNAQIRAATSTNVFSKALYRLKAALLSNPFTAFAVALTTIIALFMQSESELDKLNRKIQDIDRDYDASGKKSVDRFKELVKAVDENVDGSKAQKEALDELDRTYGKILGSEALELDSLKALGGQYGELIDMIEAYNAKKRGDEKETAIKSHYATILDNEKDDLMDYLNQAGMSAERQAEFMSRLDAKLIEYSGQANAAIIATDETFQEFADDMSRWAAEINSINIFNPGKLIDSWGVYFREVGGLFGGQGMDYLYNYARALEAQNNTLENNERDTRNAVRGLDEYAEGIDKVSNAIKNLDWSSIDSLYNSLKDYNVKHPQNTISIPADFIVYPTYDPEKAETEYEKFLESSNMQIYAIFDNLRNIASEEGVAIPEEFYKQAKSVVEGNKDFSFIDFDGIENLFKSDKAKKAVKESRLLYNSFAPSDDTIRMFNRKFMTLADSMDVPLDKMQKYLMKSVDNLGEHRKKLSDEVTNLLKEIARLEWTKKALTLFGLPANAVEKKIQESRQTLKLLQSTISTIPDIEGIGKKKGGRKSDQRLQTLKEIASKMAEVNKEYDQLLKKEGHTKAIADTQKLFAASFKQMQATADKYGFKLPAFEVPKTVEDVQKWYKAIMDNIKRLNLKNADKVLIELGFKSDKAAIDKQQKDIEEQIKELADRISRTKTAKEFYDKILGMTGDVELAANVSLQIYGSTGKELSEQIKEQFTKAFEGLRSDHADIMPAVTDIINRGAYEELRDYIEMLPKDQRKAAEDLVKVQQQMSVKQYEQWLKDLEKAKDYADKRIELSRYTANQIAAIEERIAKLNPQADDYELQKAMLEKIIQGYKDRESKEAAGLDYEQFKNSALYVQLFENLDNASKTSLVNMRNRLLALKDQWKNLSPEQVKELAKRLEELDKKIAQRNPFKSIAGSIKKLREMLKSGRTKEGDAKKAFDAEAERDVARDKILFDEKAYEAAVKQYGAESGIAKEKRKIADESAKAYRNAEKAADSAAENAKEWEDLKEKIDDANSEIDKYQDKINGALDDVKELMQSFGMNEIDTQFFEDMQNGFNGILDGAHAAADAYVSFMSGNYASAATGAVSAIKGIAVGISNLFSAGKVRKANKEIKRQQELLEQLQYRFEKVSAAADKLFGKDYINNYNEQMRILEAQAAAYQKQLDAEKSKGKKADKTKQKEYEEAIRDVKDQMEDLRSQVAEKALGTDLSSAAKDFATSWLEARASFGNTVNAIKEKYKEMIKSFMIEMAASKIMETLLSPLFKDMTTMIEKGDIEGGIDKLVKGMDTIATKADGALELFYQKMLSKGYDMQKIFAGDDEDGVKGYSRNIATASEESIYGLTQATNTQNHYISYIPRIAEEVTAIRILSEKRDSDKGGGMTDIILLQNQAMSHLTAISQHTSETVNECRRIALACEEEVAQLKRVIAPRGSRAPYSVQVNIN